MSRPLPRWFAHRGGGNAAPENTLAGLRLAARLGFRAVEFDVMLSGDGTPVLIHDETLERTTNGSGRVADTPDEILFRLDAGNGERIPRLSEAAALCRQYGLLANVEIKPSTGCEVRTGEVVAEQVVQLWRGASVAPLLSSFSLEALERAADVAPDIERGLLFEAVPANWRESKERLRAVSLHCDAALVGDEILAEARRFDVPVLCYTVNSPELAKSLFERGVSAVFTDNLEGFAGDTTAYKALHFGG